MTKPVRVISFFLTILIAGIFISRFSHAEYLLQPVPDSRLPSGSNNQLVIVTDSNNKPPVTFGDLLNGTPVATPSRTISTDSGVLSPQTLENYYNQSPESVATRSGSVKAVLTLLETSYNESQKKLAEFNQQNNLQPTIFNRPFDSAQGKQLTTDLPAQAGNRQLISTPYIPIPTFIAGINDIIKNRQSASGYQNSAVISLTPTTDLPSQAGNQQLTTNLQPSLTPTPAKTNFTIALLGDSMIDTLGPDLLNLSSLLKQSYPNLTFVLLNYGQGATDLESGLKRLTNYTDYLGKTYAPLLSFKPDILVVESFAYNHWSAELHDLDRQWLTIAKIIDTVRQNSPDTKIVLAATIAPDANTFGDGILNWPQNLKWDAAMTTKAYLQNMVNFATSMHYPLADAYHASMKNDGSGFSTFINQGDHIHPSPEGTQLFSQKVVEAIKENHLL